MSHPLAWARRFLVEVPSQTRATGMHTLWRRSVGFTPLVSFSPPRSVKQYVDLDQRLAAKALLQSLSRLRAVSQILLHPFYCSLLHVSCILSGRGEYSGVQTTDDAHFLKTLCSWLQRNHSCGRLHRYYHNHQDSAFLFALSVPRQD